MLDCLTYVKVHYLFHFVYIIGCANMSTCDTYCIICVNNSLRTQECYEVLVQLCQLHFDDAMLSMNSNDWCSLEKIKRYILRIPYQILYNTVCV